MADSSKGAKAPIGSEPVQDAELQATDQSLPQASDWEIDLMDPLRRAFYRRAKLGGALNYVRNHWAALNKYVAEGALAVQPRWGLASSVG